MLVAAVFAAVAIGHAGAARGDTIEACGYGVATTSGGGTCLSLPDALAQADSTRGDDTIRLQPGAYCPIAIEGRFDRLELVGEGIGGLAFSDGTPVTLEGFEAGLSTFRYSPVYCGSDYPDALVSISDDAGRVTLRNLTVDGAPNGGTDGPSDGIAIARTEATLLDVVAKDATRYGVSYSGGSFGFDDFEMDESALLDDDTGLQFAGEGSLVSSTVSGSTDGVVARGDFHLIHDTIAGNEVGVSAPCCASTMQVTYSIVAGNSVNDCGLTADWENASFNAYNLLGPSCPRQAATDIAAAEATLAAPGRNGGPTPSIVPPSDAADVEGVLCSEVDQREFRVEAGTVCDIGSIEVGASGAQQASVPESFDLGQVDSGSTATRSVGLATTGGDQLDVYGMSISGVGFSIAGDECTHAVLIPGHNRSSCSVSVTAAPAADGPLSGTLTFEDTAGTQTVTLTALGVTRPLGAPDSYDVDGAPLEVDAPGVLANDAAGTTVEKVVTEPRDGTLTGPAADGSFRYASDPGFVGGDSFSYVLVDGAGVESEPIDVTLHVVTSAPGADLYVDDAWTGLEPGVDPDGDGPATAFGDDAFATLSDALDAAGTAAVVHVAAGDYADGRPTIDEQAVHVVGAGAATTHLTLEGGLLVDAPNAVVEGLDVHGLGSWDADTRTFSGSSASTAIAISRYGFGTTIRDCVVGDAYVGVLAQGFGGESEMFGLLPDADDVEDVEVEHVVDGIVFEGVAGGRIAGNQVHDTGDASGDDPQAAILVDDPDEVGPIFGNEITGNTVERSGDHGISVRTPGNAIEDNTISDSGTVYPVFAEPSGIEVGAHDNAITGNAISGSAFAGIEVDGTHTTIDGNAIIGTGNGGADGGRTGGTGSGGAAILLATDGEPGTTITNNTLGGNAGWAILQTDSGGDSSSTVAHANDLSGNDLGGVENRDAATLDATGNWWGDASGPSGAGPGSGVSVSEHVLYDPWLDCAPGETCAPPVAAFSATPSAITGSLEVAVDASDSTGVESYAWDFGDGSSGTGATASHTYAAAGTYTIALTVTDGAGRTATVSHAVTVPAAVANLAPAASFVATPSAEPGWLDVTVDGSASADEDGAIAGYAWDFGDGATAAGATAGHTYLAAGTFEIELTVTDDGGATATATHSVTVPASTESPEPVAFASPETFATGTQPWYVAAADLDGDGNLDLVAPNLHSGNVSVLLGDGTGGYADQTTFAAGKNPGAVAVGDLDGDGTPDLAVTDGGNGTLSVLRGDGDGGFGDPSTFTAGAPDVFNQGVAMVDLDNDHDLDVAVANGGSTSLTILSGNGSGGFTTSPPIQVGSHPELLTAAELDGDTLADLAVVVSGENSVAVVAGRSDGDPPKLYPVGANPSDVAAGDLNGDGALDLAVTNYDDSTVSVLLGDGEGGFGDQTTFATGTQPESVAIGDLNLDGKADLAVSNGGGNSVSVLLGDGAGGFAPRADTPAGGAPLSLALADLDGNGALDIAVADASDDTITVLLNESRPLPSRNEPPTASFTATPSDEPGSLEVAVDASASSDPDGEVTDYAWDFGDGGSATGVTAAYTYAAAGTYTVTLTVTDDDGATASESHEVTVPATASNAVPTASFVATSAPESLEVAVDASASSDADGTIASYAWDFGDGATATGVTSSHTYESAGTYTVTLTVTDDGGATGTVSHDVTVPAPPAENRPPEASFTSSTDGLEVSLDASGSSDPDGSIASYAWDFGDGSTGDGETPTHAYDEAGIYAVRLTVTDDGGATATVEHEVTAAAAENGAPRASFTATPSDEAGSLEVAVDASGSSDDDGTIASYAWDFGDGSSDTGVTASHTYAAAGTYTIALTVTDDGGASATDTHDVTVPATAESESPVASFEAEPSEEPGSFEVSFDASGSSGSIASYAWDFGDGASGSGAATSHTYDHAGTYAVALTVTGDGGATATVSHDVSVPAKAKPPEPPVHPKPPAPRQPVVLPPSAAFSVAPASGDTTATWTFDASSSSRASSYAWDFGDGGSASGATASHVFARPGTYTVRLTARGAGGSASAEHSVTVAPRPPRAAFYYLPARPVPARPMGFVADTLPIAGGAPLASYAWDFGDGTTATGARAGHVYLSSGSFRVTLTVTDTAGQTATAAIAVAVAAADEPSAMFVYEPTPVGVGADTTFAGIAIRRAGTWAATKLVGWSWDFGDGTTATGQQVHHVFEREGSYRVGLTVTDASGATGTVASTVVVQTNVVAVAETVSVGDTATLTPPASISVVEPIVVSDAPGLVPPAVLDVTENVGVSDVPGLVPPAVVVDDESWGFDDSTTTAVHH